MIRRYRLRKAHNALSAAQRAYDAAVSRHDTRAMHTAHETLRRALHAVMALEVGV